MKALMYHYVRPTNGGYPYLRYLSRDNFVQQLDWLGDNIGFISRKDFLRSLDDHQPRKGALLTFDDAFTDHYEFVFPELSRRGLWGIFYVPTGVYSSGKLLDVHRLHLILGRHGGARALRAANDLVDSSMLVDSRVREFREITYAGLDDDDATMLFKRMMNYFISYEHRDTIIDQLIELLLPEPVSVGSFYLDASQMREMAAGGMVIGSDGVNHLVMSKLNTKEQRIEIEQSRDFLATTIGQPIETFCYPYGGFHTFSDETEKALLAAGYRYSFNVEPRDVSPSDLASRVQALPRYDCNQFPHGKAEQPV